MLAPQPAIKATRSKLALHGVFWSAVTTLVPTIASLLVFVVTSRLLMPADFGVVAIAAALAAAAAALVPAGFGDALVQRMETDPVALDSVFWLCVGCGVVMYGALVLAAPDAALLFHAPLLKALLPVLGLRVISDAAGTVPTAMVTQTLAFNLIALRTVLATVIAASISLALVLSGFGLWALAASALANSTVATAAMFWSTGWRPRLRFSPRILAGMSGYGAYASGTRLLTFFGTQADQAFVGLVLGTTQLGFYNFARRVFAILNDVTSGALSTVAHPLFAGIKDDIERIKRGFLLATFLSSVVSFPIFIGLACVAGQAVPLLFGPHWGGALWPIRILCAVGILSCIGSLQAGLITSLGRANWWFYYQLAAGLLNIPIIILCAPHGTSLLLCVMACKTYLIWAVPVTMTTRLLTLSPGTYLRQFAAPLFAALVMAVVIFTCGRLLSGLPGWAELAFKVLLGAITYAAALSLTARARILGLVSTVLGSRKAQGSAPASASAPPLDQLKAQP